MNIEQLLSAHLDLLGTDMERWLGLLADDAVVELPYAASLGVPARLEGLPAIRRYYLETIKSFEGLTFSGARYHRTVDPEVALIEVHGSATIRPTGRRYEQDYVILVKVRDGRVVLHREYWNPIPAIAAFGLELKQ